MDPSGPGSVPSGVGTPDWRVLYRERAEAKIDYEAARTAACQTHLRLLLQHAEVPQDLRVATVAQAPDYQQAVRQRHDAYSRLQLALAAIEEAKTDLRARRIAARERVAESGALVAESGALADELRHVASTMTTRFEEALRRIQEVVARATPDA